jgi:two-component system sensor histidine kinase CpxA
MKPRIPLAAQIIALLLLHLTVLAGLFLIFFNAQFGLGWEAVFYSPVGDRVDAIAWAVREQIRQRPVNAWDNVLQEFGKFYGVKFYIFDRLGHELAGEPVTLPATVLTRLTSRQFHPPEAELSGNKSSTSDPGVLPPARARGAHGRFLMHTANPGSFWIGMPMVFHRADRERMSLSGLPPEAVPPAPGSPGLPPPQLIGGPGAPGTATTGPLAARSLGPRGTGSAGPPGIWPPPPPGLGPPPGFPAMLLASSPNLWQTRLFLDFGPVLGVIVGVLILSILFWFPFVYRITSALTELTRATERIAEGRFDTRLTTKRFDEIGCLSQSVNSMAERLNDFVVGQKRFLGDTAHELCSPVARLQMALELLESSGTTEQEKTIQDIREDVEEMSSLINELLAFSKAGLQGKEILLFPLGIKSLLDTVVAKACAEKLVTLAVADDLHALGDRMLLERAFGNIIRNGVRYAAQDGPINVAASRSGDEIVVTVTDCGPGVPPDMVKLLGQPFFRPEPSRSRSSGGVGLGLAIVKTCVEACNGTLKVKNRLPKGLEVEVHLKAAAKSEAAADSVERAASGAPHAGG